MSEDIVDSKESLGNKSDFVKSYLENYARKSELPKLEDFPDKMFFPDGWVDVMADCYESTRDGSEYWAMFYSGVAGAELGSKRKGESEEVPMADVQKEAGVIVSKGGAVGGLLHTHPRVGYDDKINDDESGRRKEATNLLWAGFSNDDAPVFVLDKQGLKLNVVIDTGWVYVWCAAHENAGKTQGVRRTDVVRSFGQWKMDDEQTGQLFEDLELIGEGNRVDRNDYPAVLGANVKSAQKWGMAMYVGKINSIKDLGLVRLV